MFHDEKSTSPVLDLEKKFINLSKTYESTLFNSSHLTKGLIDEAALSKIKDSVVFFRKSAAKGSLYQDFLLLNNIHLLVEGYFSYFLQKSIISPAETLYILEACKFYVNLVASNEVNKAAIFKRFSSWLIIKKAFLTSDADICEASLILMFNLLQESPERQNMTRSDIHFPSVVKSILYSLSLNSQNFTLWNLTCDFCLFLVRLEIFSFKTILEMQNHAPQIVTNAIDSLSTDTSEIELFMSLILDSRLPSSDPIISNFLEDFAEWFFKVYKDIKKPYFVSSTSIFSLFCEALRNNLIQWQSVFKFRIEEKEFFLFLKRIFVLTFEKEYEPKFLIQSNLLFAFTNIIESFPNIYEEFIEHGLLPLILLCTIVSDADCTRRESAIVFIKHFVGCNPERNSPLLTDLARQNKIQIPL